MTQTDPGIHLQHDARRRHRTWLAGLAAVLAFVAIVYWPVLKAGLVWDDLLNFTRRGWLYYGDAWTHFIFRGFNDWSMYFRPLVVGLYVIQARLFHGAPMALHAVTLVMQLINVALVVMLARRVAPSAWRWRNHSALLAGLLFGLHPLLVETVTWIGCQFDQMQLMFALLGLLASLHIERVWRRALAVASCFFLSALCKESALAYPAIVVLFDWLRRADSNLTVGKRVRDLLARNWPVYLALACSGLGYLVLRKLLLGSATAGLSLGALIPDLARVDQIAFTYLHYWGVIGGVPVDYSPLHDFGATRFGANLPTLAMRVVLALSILAVGLLSFSRRHVATGIAVLAASLYLLPVLGILPIRFDDSVYHERYAMGAIAIVCCLLPAILHEWRDLLHKAPLLAKLLPVLPLLWLGWAVANIRATIPLWSNELALWQWAVQGNPDNALANSNLIRAYKAGGEYDNLRAALQRVLDRNLDCTGCYVNGLAFAVEQGDSKLATRMKNRLLGSTSLRDDPRVQFSYLVSVGHWQLRLGQPEVAATTLRTALELEHMGSFTHFLLSQALQSSGQHDDARKQTELAIALTAPAGREEASRIARDIRAGKNVYGQPMDAIPSQTTTRTTH